MKRKRDALIVIAAAVFAICSLAGGDACATNGTRMLAFSSRDAGMAGATTASSEDTSCLVRNPAGLVRIGTRVDVEYENLMGREVMMHTEGAAVPPTLPLPLPNIGTIQKSTITYLPGGNIAISYRIPGTDSHPVSVGCGVFTMAGVAVDYPSSRLNIRPLPLGYGVGVYDRMVDLRSVRIAPGIAAGITDRLSIGATANIAIQGLKADLVRTGDATLQETAGSGKWDFAPGAGFTVGLLYRCNDWISLGASYESHGWMGHHYKYKDCLPYIDEPPVINAGISVKPVRKVEVTFDARYINWTDVKLARMKPHEGGFGWQDQWVFATGTEWTLCRDKLKLRFGYNYGKSPIQPHVVFANALLPVIMEHHFTTGFSWYVANNLSLDFVWEHAFTGVQSDNGCGDIYSQTGVGTKVSAGGDMIGAGLGYKFN